MKYERTEAEQVAAGSSQGRSGSSGCNREKTEGRVGGRMWFDKFLLFVSVYVRRSRVLGSLVGSLFVLPSRRMSVAVI